MTKNYANSPQLRKKKSILFQKVVQRNVKIVTIECHLGEIQKPDIDLNVKYWYFLRASDPLKDVMANVDGISKCFIISSLDSHLSESGRHFWKTVSEILDQMQMVHFFILCSIFFHF